MHPQTLVVVAALTAGVLPAQFFVSIDAEPRRVAHAAWLGVAGEQRVTLDYGQPVWRAGHEQVLQGSGAHHIRLGSGSVTTLRTDVELAFGASKLAKGRWYVGARRDEREQWSLTWFDADKVDASQRGENYLFTSAPDVRVPVRVTRETAAVERFEATFTESRGTPHNLTLTMAWGPYRLHAEIAAAFDARRPEGMPAFATTPVGSGTRTASGLVYEPLVAGAGVPPTKDELVRVHYAGWLADGTLFDSSHVRGGPQALRSEWLVPGFAEALALMPPGSTFRLTLPPDLAFGTRGMGRVPPDATLVYVVSVLGIDGR